MAKIKLSNAEVENLLGSSPQSFPKYATQIINLANQNAQGTRPKTVGQQTDLIQQFPGETLAEWQTWYQEQYPNAIDEAAEKIYAMVQQLQNTITQIDKSMVRRWVEDLVLVKTFVGLRFQEAILAKVAAQANMAYRFSTTEEEVRGIDGYIGNVPVSIKPDTYKTQALQLPEQISVYLIYYTKKKDGILLEYDF